MLSLRAVSKSYAGPRSRPVLRAVSLELAAGEYLAIMGESGAGKSTLLNLIAGLDRPDAGHIVLDGTELSGLGEDEATAFRRRRIGFVFQAFHLLPYLSVAANVALPLVLNAASDAEIARRVGELLEAVGLSGRADSLPRELSGGEMQRVAIARSLAHRPALVLADEPTGNLDARAATQVLELLRASVKAQGAAGILVTHSLAAARTADRIAVLSESGLAAAEGT
jgi:putative ABC transport system ATP-binding protein